MIKAEFKHHYSSHMILRIIMFDQFKASLLNKSIDFYNFFPKKQNKNYTDSKLLNGILYNVRNAFFISDKHWSLDLSIHKESRKNVLDCFKYW